MTDLTDFAAVRMHGVIKQLVTRMETMNCVELVAAWKEHTMARDQAKGLELLSIGLVIGAAAALLEEKYGVPEDEVRAQMEEESKTKGK